MDLDITEDLKTIHLIEFNGFGEADKCLFDRFKDVPLLLEKLLKKDFVVPFRYVDSKVEGFVEYCPE